MRAQPGRLGEGAVRSEGAVRVKGAVRNEVAVSEVRRESSVGEVAVSEGAGEEAEDLSEGLKTSINIAKVPSEKHGVHRSANDSLWNGFERSEGKMNWKLKTIVSGGRASPNIILQCHQQKKVVMRKVRIPKGRGEVARSVWCVRKIV